jgi:MYXO-CTERM domain-containing protein
MRIVFLGLLAATCIGLSSRAFAQGTDLIVTIDGQTFLSNAQVRYFNASNCEEPSTTTFQLLVAPGIGAPTSQVYLWVGAQNSECQLEANRTDITNRCKPVADGAAQPVGTDNLVTGLTLFDLTGTGVVDCANRALQGQPYELYAFRAPPGSTDVPSEEYGVASFAVDVTPPNPPVVLNTVPVSGVSFVLTWEQPIDAIQGYLFYRSNDDDPETATQIEGAASDQNAVSRSFTAAGAPPGGLDLALGESTNLYVSAVDEASVVPGEGNQSELSVGWQVTAAEIEDPPDAGTDAGTDPGGSGKGCAASPIAVSPDGPSAALFAFGVLGALAYKRRRRPSR